MNHRTAAVAAVALLLSPVAFVLALTPNAPLPDRYSAILRLASGNEYRAASGVSLSDCRARIADMPAGDAYCEAEAR